MNVTKNPNGSLTLSIMHNGYRVHKTYYFYTLQEAKRLFKAYLKSL